MRTRPVRATAVILCVLVMSSASAGAGGLVVGLPVQTLDLTLTLERLPVALSASFTALETMAEDLGASPSQLDEFRSITDDIVLDVEAFTEDVPSWIPIPLIGGGVEFRLPLLVIDGIRFSGGLLSGGMVRSFAALAGLEIPNPLFEAAVELADYQGHVRADLEFSAYSLSTDVIKRFDLLLLSLNVGAGVELTGGRLRPILVYDAPSELETGIAGALEALHLEELAWSAFAVHGMMGMEIGPPFLRLTGELRWSVILSEQETWWGIRPGAMTALLGFVIRF